MITCGWYRCRGGHVWIDKGTPFMRLSSANCGLYPDRNHEELKKADENLKQIIKKLISNSYEKG